MRGCRTGPKSAIQNHLAALAVGSEREVFLPPAIAFTLLAHLLNRLSLSLADDDNTEVEGPGPSDIRPISLIDEMKRSYLDYAMSVIVSRALPDVRDGLKPVHRRILYAMQRLGLEWNKKHMKSSKVVGDTMGDFHPHGNLAIYDALVRMENSCAMRTRAS